MKNRILLLIWFILLALAAIFTGAWVYAVLLLLSALAVVAFLPFSYTHLRAHETEADLV